MWVVHLYVCLIFLALFRTSRGHFSHIIAKWCGQTFQCKHHREANVNESVVNPKVNSEKSLAEYQIQTAACHRTFPTPEITQTASLFFSSPQKGPDPKMLPVHSPHSCWLTHWGPPALCVLVKIPASAAHCVYHFLLSELSISGWDQAPSCGLHSMLTCKSDTYRLTGSAVIPCGSEVQSTVAGIYLHCSELSVLVTSAETGVQWVNQWLPSNYLTLAFCCQVFSV